MKLKIHMTLFLLVFSLMASAEVRFEGFAWKADNSFEVRASNSQPHIFRGVLIDAKRSESRSADVTLTAHAFAKGAFVVLTFTQTGQELGQVYVLELNARTGQHMLLQNGLIQGRALTLVSDIEGVLIALKERKSWAAPQSIRAMVSYFDANPRKLVSDFYDSVELGHIVLPRPQPKSARRPAPNRRRASTIEQPRKPAPERARSWHRRRPPPKKTKRRDGYPNLQDLRDYPGQRIRRGGRYGF